MSALTKILIGVLFLVLVALGVEGFLYFQTLNKPLPPSSTPASQATPELIEITGPVALVNYVNLFDISKRQVEEWAKASGSVEIPIYSGPIPTLSPDTTILPEMATLSAQSNTVPRQRSVKVIAGYFKGAENGIITLSQLRTDITMILYPSARFWIRDGNKLQMVSRTTTLNSLLESNSQFSFIKPNDLFLAINIKEESGYFRTPALVVFR